ncbi:methyltransferase [Phenylobacterium sp. VNQ135]|uniref:methyltransferase n=1 Tax=Phenylobacterium sp. VNQ135 TaxID=3400922 RepID=UPI003C115E21
MDGSAKLNDPDLALTGLLGELDRRGYDFTPPTPATHRRVAARRDVAQGGDLRDILGWSLPFSAGEAPRFLTAALTAAGVLTRLGDGWMKSRLRVARLKGRLFLHSAFPTEDEDSVFLGPDSYRFADFIARELDPTLAGRVVDVGGGAGVGALTALQSAAAAELTMTDINPTALRLARINAAHAGATLALRRTSGLDGVEPGLAAVLANPPYMADSHQTYRDGGAMHGGRLSVDWAEAALAKLAPGGRLLLYTGSAIVAGGRDELGEALAMLAQANGANLDYREIDPDVFGEELETPAYADVERIAVVTAVMTQGR